MENNFPYRRGNRYEIPNTLKQIDSPYDQDSKLFQDLAQRGIKAVKVFRLDLSVAGQLHIAESGYHFCLFGFENSSNEPVNTTANAQVWINQNCDDGSVAFPARHSRGYSGPFGQLFLKWAAQLAGGATPVWCYFVIYKSSEQPWINGESAT